MARSAAILVIALAISGCAGGPDHPGGGTPPGTTPGTAIDPGGRPDVRTCQTTIRADLGRALAVRAVLSSTDFGPLPIAADDATARAAAVDPASDLVVFGIPVTRAELAASRTSGIAIDSMLPLTARIHADRESYGNLWIERGEIVVGVLRPEAAAALRCFEPADPTVRYVAAAWSMAAIDALQDRIGMDWQSGLLKADGIDIRMTGQTVRDDVFVIEVTVHGLTPAIADELRRRYGDPVVPIEGEGATPA